MAAVIIGEKGEEKDNGCLSNLWDCDKMKLPNWNQIKGLRKLPGDKLLGEKEKGLGKFMIPCVDCGKPLDIDKSSCPRKIKKLLKRNLKMRGIAMLALEKMHARCSSCEAKVKDKRIKKDDVKKVIKEASEEAKEKFG